VKEAEADTGTPATADAGAETDPTIGVAGLTEIVCEPAIEIDASGRIQTMITTEMLYVPQAV
jgi:hypothetical protein